MAVGVNFKKGFCIDFLSRKVSITLRTLVENNGLKKEKSSSFGINIFLFRFNFLGQICLS